MGLKYVRIKPYDPQHGFRTRRYTIGDWTFDVSHGWYMVDDKDAAYLQTVRQRLNDPKSPAVFEICTEAEAREIDEHEASLEKVRRPMDQARMASISREDLIPKTKRRRRPPKRRVLTEEPSPPVEDQPEEEPTKEE